MLKKQLDLLLNKEGLKTNIKETKKYVSNVSDTINQRIDEEVSALTETINTLDEKVDKNHEELREDGKSISNAIYKIRKKIGLDEHIEFPEDFKYETIIEGISGNTLNTDISNKLNFTGVTNNQEIIVNTPVGNLKVGDKIEFGDSIFTVLTKLLTQIYPPSSVTPTCTIVNNGDSFSTIYEVGTIVSPNLNYNYIDGKYSSYTSSINYEVINANCTISSVTYYYGNTVLPDGITNITLKDGNSSALKVSITYNTSTIKPKDSSLKEVDGIQIGICSSSNTYKTYFKYFVSYTSKAQRLPKNSEAVRALNNYSGFITTTNSITIVSSNTTSEAYNLIVCVPKGVSVSAETVGVTGIHNFIKGDEVIVNVGGNTTQKYSVFYVEGTPVYKNLKITKGTITNN